MSTDTPECEVGFRAKNAKHAKRFISTADYRHVVMQEKSLGVLVFPALAAGKPYWKFPPNACRGERCGVWGRTAPIKPVCFGALIFRRRYWQLEGFGFEASLMQSEQGVTKSELVAQRLAQGHGQLVEFESEAFVGFQRGGRVAREHVPDLHQELASEGGDGDIAVAFSSEEFPAPLAQGCGAAHAQKGLSTLDEEMTDVTTASFAYTEFDGSCPSRFGAGRG